MTHDLIVIGAGAAGLTVAGGCARLGLVVALIEEGAMGGECLATGCVPSKALIAAARHAEAVREAASLGIITEPPRVDFAAVRAHVHGAMAAIAPHDSAARFEAWGVEVIRDTARFVGSRELVVGGRRLTAPRIVIATGSKPRIPPVPGLAKSPFLTNETLFDLDALPARLLIIGAGAIGLEMAQAFRRLGAEVVVFDKASALGRDDPDAVGIVTERLRREGVVLHLGSEVARVSAQAGAVTVTLAEGSRHEGSDLLVATGRTANVERLDLAAAGVEADDDGIRVDTRRRTSAPGVYAIGDCRAGPRLTHAAGHEGARLVVEIGFGVPASVDFRALSHVTYTEPELAQVGLTEAEARRQGGRVAIAQERFADNDRAITEAATDGFLKIVWRNRKLVGVTIVGRDAGDLVLPWVMMIGGKASPWAISSTIVPYPTRSEISKAAAFASYEPLIFSTTARRWCRLVAKLRRLWSRRAWSRR